MSIARMMALIALIGSNGWSFRQFWASAHPVGGLLTLGMAGTAALAGLLLVGGRPRRFCVGAVVTGAAFSLLLLLISEWDLDPRGVRSWVLNPHLDALTPVIASLRFGPTVAGLGAAGPYYLESFALDLAFSAPILVASILGGLFALIGRAGSPISRTLR